LQTQKFDTTHDRPSARHPGKHHARAVDGSNLTYSNIEQSWIEFADYTLAAYTGEIEEIFNRLLPRGRTAKFDWDSSQRANMSDRYTAYKTAIEAGFLTVDDVRRKEAAGTRKGRRPMNIEKRTIAWKGLTLRSADDSGTSTVEGVAVPFGDIIDTWDGAETFDRDCSFEGLDEAKLCFEHGETIGRITKAESTDDGLHITARISDTARGRDAMTLIHDGVLDSFSVGFIPLESQKDRDGITHRRKVRLLETSIVSWPAYQNAKMTKSAAPAVEQRKETMENNNELMDLIQSMQEEQRGIKAEISKMGAKPAPAAIGAAYRSHGEYMQALARGDEQAMTVMKECRDLISTKDTGNTATWIADDLKLIEDRRKVLTAS
jgi:HK97 family phage prohead protease